MSDEVIHAGRFLELARTGNWEFVRRRNATAVVCVIAVTNAGELVLVEQHRAPVAGPVIELPAGLVGDSGANEDLLDAARRELEEETGFSAARFSVIARGPSSAGLTNEIVTLVRADGLKRTGSGGGVDGEDITVHLVPLDSASAWLTSKLENGRLIDHKVWAALWFSRGEQVRR